MKTDLRAQDEERSFLLFGTLSVFFGNLATLVVLAIAYINYRLFENYAQMLLWATLLAIGLHRTRAFLAASSRNDWIARVESAFLKHRWLYVFLAVSWLWALCNTFGTLLVLFLHGLLVLGAIFYVRLLSEGIKLHERLGFSNTTFWTLMLLVGAFSLFGVMLVFFALKCTEEAADAFSALSSWGKSMANATGDDNAVWVQVSQLLETDEVQGALDSAREAVSGMLDSVTEVGGEGLVNHVKECYKASEGNERQVWVGLVGHAPRGLLYDACGTLV